MKGVKKTSVSKALIIKIRSEEDNVRVTQTAAVDITFTSSLCEDFLLECSVSPQESGMMKLLTFSR